MSRSLRALAVGVTAAALLTSMQAPAQAAASACTHHFSGPQVCISTTGESGSANPGKVWTSWTNPPRDRTRATVHITEPDGFTYTITARRRGGQLIASTIPGDLLDDGKLCARYQGSRRTACVQIIDRS
ncbi:hypothetical protein [Streptomyces fulvorobeus]|uniref:Secreted protein n=1 Tax=Streptomyces fulvorobeus TaxID=284028 RepID=A0A7J0CG68_9ACTN|nr:hypothetical protein [Streptomyces fulvorobeus]NYE44872.1 hypothetical protein [Streptomyces fulvorobeus]GFN01409.1 hypothetical protein Sfulv_62190 [Streptomyces fulvorobeus]